MLLKELASFLDSAIPLSFQEDYDNAGLQTGEPGRELTSALLTLDVTEDVLDEAVNAGCNVIVSHHPVIFGGLKQLSGRNASERIIMKAVKNDVAVYSAHTNLDVLENGVSRKMAEKMGLVNMKPLLPLKNRLVKLVTFIPGEHLDKVREALFAAGAGAIGNYDMCGFAAHGTGSFRAGEQANPFKGERGELHFESEVRFETVLFAHLKRKVIKALLDSHPYEEVAYDIYPLENDNISAGMGCIGEIPESMTEKDFLTMLGKAFSAGGIRYSKLTGNRISKIAMCGGAGGPYINDAIAAGAHAFVTGDIRYHSFLDAGNKILLADIGHFESEKFSVEILYDLIVKKFPKFAIRFSEINTNPINYY